MTTLPLRQGSGQAYAEVIGDPIAHSKSPLIHNFWLDKSGIDADYQACHVRPEALADYFAQRREDAQWRGCNVTIPHKQRIAPFVDTIRAEAAKVGAINTVFRHPEDGLCATNTDVDGVREALRGIEPSGRPVVVVGAGGAARSAFAHLDGLGCSEIRVLARSPDKARTVLEDFNLRSRVCPFAENSGAFDDAAAVINATQLGMAGQEAMPRFILDELSRTAPDCLVFDMVYVPLQTDLLSRAGELNRATSHGLTMLIGQARTAFARFFGAVPGYDDDAELLRILAP